MRSTSILKSRTILFAALMTTTALVSVMPMAAYAADKVVDGGATETISTTETFDFVTVGDTGTGTLTVSNGGEVTANEDIRMGFNNGAIGTISNGRWHR